MIQQVLTLTGLQQRSLFRTPLLAVSAAAFVPLVWLNVDEKWMAGWIAAGMLYPGIYARGASAGAIPVGRSPLPTLPISRRARAGATLLTAHALVLPGYVLLVAYERFLGRESLGEALLHALTVALVTLPFITVGAVFPNIRRLAWAMLALVSGVLGATAIGAFESLPVAAAWGILPSALLVAWSPPANGGEHRPASGSAATAEIQGPTAWSAVSTSPTRAFWGLVARQRVLASLVLGGSALLSFVLTAGKHAMYCAMAAGAVAVASMFAPIGPATNPATAAGVLARLPIAPRTAWRNGLATALLWFALSVTFPTIAFVSRLHWTPEGRVDDTVGSFLYATLLWFLGCAALLVRAGTHLRPLYRRAAPANVALALGLLLLAAGILGPLGPAAHWGDPDGHPWRIVLAVGVLTAAVLGWADRSVGFRDPRPRAP